jgi:L,D-peptidoglycan transpeptidase YkuD (ErfK/YbiS/YcfS/YnhG family)
MSKIFSVYANGTLALNPYSEGGQVLPCALGKAGIVSAQKKQEGDLASPAGLWPLRRIFYRADRLDAPKTSLQVQALTQNDGWCDDPHDPNYNQFITLPYTGRHERLWRDDQVYDIIVVMGYNDDPVVKGKGSAIFMHVARPDFSGTEGCVALALPDLLTVLAAADSNSCIEIIAET